MIVKRKAYIFTFLFTLLLAINFAHAQVDRQDTIASVKRLQSTIDKAYLDQDFLSAIKYLNKAKKLVAKTTDSVLSAEVMISSARLYYYLQHFTKAAEQNATAISILNNTDQKKTLGEAFVLNGLILTNLGDYESARTFINEAKKLYKVLGLEQGEANVALAMGVLNLKQRRFTEAIDNFDSCLVYYYNNNYLYEQAFVQVYKADALIQSSKNRRNIAEANINLLRAKSIIDANNFYRLNLMLLKVTVEIEMMEGSSLKAQKDLNIYLKKKDSISQVYLSAIATESDIDSNIGDLKEIIKTQRNDIVKQAKSLTFNQATTALSIALMIILSLLTLSLYKNNRLRKKANNLLKDKNTELIVAKDKAEKASAAKAQFLSTITHELRTPLYAVTGLTHLLMEEDPKPVQKEHLESLRFSGDYLLSLINNILDINKLEAKKVELDSTTFNLRKRINDVLIALKKSADDQKNKIHFEFDESIPQFVNGDTLRISQILINLVGNAAKFTQNGNIWIRVKRISSTEKTINLHFEVEDDGVGISQKKQQLIFENFSQGSSKINRKFGGSGLGLAIVKNLLELLNSKIILESKLGLGSKFSFNLTLKIPESNDISLHKILPVVKVDYKKLEALKVLIVEDNLINQMVTKKILAKNHIGSTIVGNGIDAVEAMKAGSFDVVLMDIHMPGISGIEATVRIRKFNTTVPILALTAVTLEENLDDFYRAGFNDIIPKPFKPKEFFEKIYKAVFLSSTVV